MARVKLPGAILAAVLAGGSALQIMTAATPVLEGNPLVAYQDMGGVWTICGGVTKGVKRGDVETVAGCERRNAEAIAIGLADVKRCVGAAAVERWPQTMQAGHGLFSYNIGGPKYCGSTPGKAAKVGDFARACAGISKWRFVAGKDCATSGTFCPGIIQRRAIERTLCEWEL